MMHCASGCGSTPACMMYLHGDDVTVFGVLTYFMTCFEHNMSYDMVKNVISSKTLVTSSPCIWEGRGKGGGVDLQVGW